MFVLFLCTCIKGTIYIFVKCERISIEMFKAELLLKKKNLQFWKLCCNKDLFNSFSLVVILLRNNLFIIYIDWEMIKVYFYKTVSNWLSYKNLDF